MSYFSHRYFANVSESRDDSLVIFASTDSLDNSALSDLVMLECSGKLPDHIALIVRAQMLASVESMLNDDLDIVARFSSIGFYIFSYTSTGQLTLSSVKNVSDESADWFNEEQFKRRAVLEICRRREGLIEGNKAYHFENPSKRHTNTFVRLANLLSDFNEISFLAFCCLPFLLPDVRIIYIDTLSLHPVSLAIQEQLRSFDSERRISTINFQSYFKMREFNFRDAAEALVLISASTTGSLAERLEADHGFERARIVQILYLSKRKSVHPILCDLAKTEHEDGFEPVEAVERPQCKECARHSVAIPLQGDSFFLPGPETPTIVLKEKHLNDKSRDFLLESVGTKALRIGLDDKPTAAGDHQFSVCLSTLISVSPGFKVRLDYMIERNFPALASHIVFADSKSKVLAKYIGIQVGLPSERVVEIAEIQALSTALSGPVVVVADAAESGRCLQDISRRLRDIASNVPIIYILGLAKCCTEVNPSSLRSALVFTKNPEPHQFCYVNSIVLPPSMGFHPWVNERAFLNNCLSQFSGCLTPEITKVFQARFNRLARASEPLTNDLFWQDNNELDKVRLRAGFAFWPNLAKEQYSRYSEADVYFTIACVLQNCRAAGSSAKPSGLEVIRSNWLQQTRLHPNNFNIFNDSIIQASLLRAAYPRELNFSHSDSDSRVMRVVIEDALTESIHSNHTAAAEFLLALCTRRLQLTEDDESKIEKFSGEALSARLKAFLNLFGEIRRA